MKAVISIAMAGLLGSGLAQAESFAERVARASVGDHRSAEAMARNEYRNPVSTLSFFGFEEGDRVLEIWPGGGWYTEMLAPAIRDHGTLVWPTGIRPLKVSRSTAITYRRACKPSSSQRPDVYDQVQEVSVFAARSLPRLGEATAMTWC